MSLLILLVLLCSPARSASVLVAQPLGPVAQPLGPVAQPLGPVAGSVVRSKEWITRRGVSREEEFRGDVRYESAGMRLSSDWALFKHADRSWQARGCVVLRRRLDDGAELSASGEKAGHEQNFQRGYLEPAPGKKVAFTRTPPGAGALPGELSDYGEAGRVSWDGERRMTLSAGAKVWGPRLELAADTAVYERGLGLLTLNGGRPVVRKIAGVWTTAFAADEVVAAGTTGAAGATESPRRIEARGKVKGWLVFPEQALKERAK